MKYRIQMGSRIVTFDLSLKDIIRFNIINAKTRLRRLLRKIGYYHVRHKIKLRFESHAIAKRLVMQNKNEKEIVSIADRFYRYQIYIKEKEFKKLRRENVKKMADVADKLNVPQWDIRTHFENN